MQIEHGEHEKRGEFYINQDGKRVAEIAYLGPHNGQIYATHTEVDRSLEGQGIGSELLAALVEFAREQKLSIVAQCPFVRASFERNPDGYKDVWAR